MRTIQEIKDQLFIVGVKERMLNNIEERSKIVHLCDERTEAPHYTRLCKYLICTEKQARLFAKLLAIRLADTAEEIAAEKEQLLNELQKKLKPNSPGRIGDLALKPFSEQSESVCENLGQSCNLLICNHIITRQ